jgi:Na+/phosphate symporter
MEGVQMSDHIPGLTKMIGDTPISDSTAHNVADLGMLCRSLERELTAANSIIRQQQLLDEQNLRLQDRIKRLEEALAAYLDLLGTDGVEQGVAVVREMKERISKLNDYVAALETAGDLMANELSYGYDVDMWHEAKEAKL